MPTIKNAFERHKILDRCFRDRRRKYYIDDLLDIVNKFNLSKLDYLIK